MHEELLTSREVTCPYCSTRFDLLVDTSQGSHRTWEDCPRCCAPIQIEISVSPGSGELMDVVLGRDDDVF
ncbi:CPXCG motif-containing cysteine-rich protein [Modicisalibacter xianhensis]|uniref:Cysteine-rich CPXCG n=1 Tax=Modicisalibacter xianhensis TaxID=442341 RepID=A0A1I3EBF7_9GAMM|nr:CPXCG motif-containing cysteine-rich protein [Halomonas xianhensis]SFH96219.1 Cysteine-rich CPXCG [Halomonas xianhensis]